MANQHIICSGKDIKDYVPNLPKNFEDYIDDNHHGIFFLSNNTLVSMNTKLISVIISKDNGIHIYNVGSYNNDEGELYELWSMGDNCLQFNCDTIMQSLSASDINLKENISIIDNALDKIDKINPVKYSFIKDKNKRIQFGVIAQEIKEIFPDLVYSNDKGLLSVDYNSFIGLLVKGIKEQQTQIEKLKKELSDINKYLSYIKDELNNNE